jgi:tetratricopeptide (TPR) repeat protein
LWWANTPEAKKQMAIVAKQLMPNDQASIAMHTNKVVPIETIEISSPTILDILWANFFATGDERFVKRIMSILPWFGQGNAGKTLLAGTAKWSLTCNAHQHKRVLQICQRERENQPALKKVLSEVIAKATKPTQQKTVTQTIHENRASGNKQISKHKLSDGEESSLANYSNLGLGALQQRNYVEARQQLLSAQRIAESSSSEHPQLLKMLGYLADTYNRLGDRESSEELYKQVIASCEKSISSNSKECGLLHDGLGVTLLSTGKIADAKVHFKRANEIFRRLPGTDNEDLAINLGNLASLYQKEGDNTQAESNWKQAIAILEKAHDDQQLAIALHNLADLYRAQAKYTEAEPLYKQSISLEENSFGPDHPYLITDLRQYADVLEKTNRKSEADQLLARARSIAAKQK